MSLISRLFFTLLTLTLALPALAQGEKLIFAVDVIRHGDRTPITDLPNSNYHWPQGPGQLTPLGMQQEFQLGQAMHKRYIEAAQLLPSQYDVQTMYVHSSDFDRTLMSAESLLFGLYPLGSGPMLPQTNTAALPSGYQPIPIHTVPQKDDTLLVFDSLNKDQYKPLLQKYVFSRADWQKKTAELQPQFARWSELTGMHITRLEQLIFLGDTLLIRQIHQVPPPPGMTEEDIKTIIAAKQWAFAAIFRPAELGQFTGHQLLAKIVGDLKQTDTERGALKFLLISAHDSTILSLMSAMGSPMETSPRYASDLSIGLYEDAAGNRTVRIILNDEPVLLPACGRKVCTLQQFTSLA